MADIFISYAREDEHHAKKLFEFISRRLELEIFLDTKSLLTGVYWKEEVMEAIRKSRFVILLLSSRSVNKVGFIQKEIREALDRLMDFPPGKIFLIPARIDHCKPQHRALNVAFQRKVDRFRG